MKALGKYPWVGILTFGFIILGSLVLKVHTDEAIQIDYLNAGEVLWGGVPAFGSKVDWHLPAASITAAALYDRAPYLNRFIPFLALVLLTALCAEIFSPVLAMAAIPIWILSYISLSFPQSVFTLLILLVAGFLVFRARHPSVLSACAVALSIGCSLLYRSTLVFFPPLLVFAEIFTSWRKKARISKKEILILLIVPYLFLLPWIFMNAELYHKFIPLEGGEANSNVVVGALGIVGTVEGNWGIFSSKTMTTSALGWAMSEVAKRPLRYINAVFLRLFRVIGWNPFLFMLAIAGFWLFPFRSRISSVALLILYLLLIHCLMAVEFAYFMPLRPLLAVFASLPLIFFLSPEGETTGIIIFATTLAMSVLVCFFVAEKVALYPQMTASKDALNKALLRHPRDGWLLHEKGMRDLLEGNLEIALPELSRAVRALPLVSYKLDLAWAEFLNGQPKALMEFHFPQNGVSPDVAEKAYLMQALAAFSQKKLPEGRNFIVRALSIAVGKSFVRDPSSPREIEVEKKLRLASIHDFYSEFASLWGVSLLNPGVKATFNKELARVSMEALDDTKSQSPIESVSPAPVPISSLLQPQEYLHEEALYLQEYAISRPIARFIFNFLARRYPENGVYRKDLAICEYLMGDKNRAEADFKLSRSLNPHDPSIYLSLVAMDRERGNFAAARKDCQGALKNLAWDYELASAVYSVCNNIRVFKGHSLRRKTASRTNGYFP